MLKKIIIVVPLLSVLVFSCYDRTVPVPREEIDDASDLNNSDRVPADAQSSMEQTNSDSGARPDRIQVQVPTERCGNGIIEGDEQCDGEMFSPQISCESFGYRAGGELTCDRATCTFDFSRCLPEPKDPECGNGIVESGEQCEADLFKEMKCSELESGYNDGDVTCNRATCRFDLSECGIESECGNGILEGTEQCDGSELNETTCGDLNYGFSGGTLRCDPDTCTYDISDCDFSEDCGNGIVEPGEQCDGSNLAGRSCTGLGYALGILACSSDCRYDTSGCSNNTTNVVCTRGGCFPVSPFNI